MVDLAAATAFDFDFGAGVFAFSGLLAIALPVLLAVLAGALAATMVLAVDLPVAFATIVFSAATGLVVVDLVVAGFVVTDLVALAVATALVDLALSLPFEFSWPKADAQFWTYLSVAPLLRIVTAETPKDQPSTDSKSIAYSSKLKPFRRRHECPPAPL